MLGKCLEISQDVVLHVRNVLPFPEVEYDVDYGGRSRALNAAAVGFTVIDFRKRHRQFSW